MIFQADKPSIAWRYYRESPGRWVIVGFPNRFAEDPAWYDRSITPEIRSQALITGLEAMREVLRRGSFTVS